jgi:hypothetical protein
MRKHRATVDGIEGVQSLDELIRIEVGLAYFNLDLIGAHSIDNLYGDENLRIQFLGVRHNLARAHAKQLAALRDLVADIALRPVHKGGLRNLHPEERIELELTFDAQRVSTLLDPQYVPRQMAYELWGRPHLTRGVREHNPASADIATTVHRFQNHLAKQGFFDLKYFGSEEHNLRGWLFPRAAQRYDIETPSDIPFAILSRIKNPLSAKIKVAQRKFTSAVNYVRETLEAGEAHKDWPKLLQALDVSDVDTSLKKKLRGPEVYWPETLRQKIILSRYPFHTKLNDVGGITCYYLGGHRPGAEDSMTRTVERFLTNRQLLTHYTPTKTSDSYRDESANLHRIKVRLQPHRLDELSNVEVIFVDIRSHIAEYEFGKHNKALYDAMKTHVPGRIEDIIKTFREYPF